MAQILRTRGIAWDHVCEVGHMIECEHACQIGDIIDECFVFLGRGPFDNTCQKGDYTIIIPLMFISVAETHSDLSQYGFIKIGKDRWINGNK